MRPVRGGAAAVVYGIALGITNLCGYLPKGTILCVK